jgi:Uma2 family endonuclease
MATATRPKPVTFDEFCFLVQEGQKADLIDGVIFMASPDNTDANRLFSWLIAVMKVYCQEKDLGEVYGSRVALRFDRINGPEPDILFVAKHRNEKIKRGFIDGRCDVAVEIVSPDSVDRDYAAKRHLYERNGVSEYWILDETKQTQLFLRLDKKGKYREVRLRRGVFHSAVLPGFFLRPHWLWQQPQPMLRKVLDEILAASA